MKEIIRYNPKIKEGLSHEQVKNRITNNLVNFDTTIPTKSIKNIIKDNTFTLFNFINIILAFLIFITGAYKNLLFLGIVILNTMISTFQEIHSKKIIDKLTLLSTSKVRVIRSGTEEYINLNDVVLDDIIILKAGNQVVVDCYIMEGSCIVNESFITGEQDGIIKNKNELLLSGSFISEGNVICKVEHIGNDNYTSKITSGAKYIKKINSELMSSLTKILKLVSILIIPVGILFFLKQYYIIKVGLNNSLINTVASLLGMIPEGLILLTSSVLAVSTIRLSKKQVLVQDMYCIESLARVDTICLDKTGTITEGIMEVKRTISFNKNYKINDVIKIIANNLEDENATMKAIKFKYLDNDFVKDKVDKIPFSSNNKYSGIVYNDNTYLIGSHDILFAHDQEIIEKIDRYTNDFRVITVAYASNNLKNKKIDNNLELVGIILLEDKIRENALKTLAYFDEQGVDIKIISGDNLNTVSKIAKRVGIKNLVGVDLSKTNLEDIKENIDKYGIFVRVKPHEKKEIISYLQKMGKVVAMTGDGVNDVLALKEADCSITVLSGTEAARNVSQLILLNDDFDSMPNIVYEGRRTINNIERSSSLFLVKTLYSTLLALFFLLTRFNYPLVPIQLTLINFVTIGVPSFVLALEPNNNIIKGKFLNNVLNNALPSALTAVFLIIFINLISMLVPLNILELSTITVYVLALVGFKLIYKISIPFNIIRKCLLITMISIFLFAALYFTNFFQLCFINIKLFMFMLIIYIVHDLILNLVLKINIEKLSL